MDDTIDCLRQNDLYFLYSLLFHLRTFFLDKCSRSMYCIMLYKTQAFTTKYKAARERVSLDANANYRFNLMLILTTRLLFFAYCLCVSDSHPICIFL